MIISHRRGTIIIILTILAALILNIVKIPHWAQGLRPEWMPLVIIFWSINFPERISIGTAWMSGFLLDLFRDGAIAGQYALAMLMVSYIAIKIHQRFLIYPFWQQALTILLLLLVYQLLLFIVKGMGGTLYDFGWRFWATTVTSTMVWPLVYLALSAVKNRIRLAY